MAQAVWYTVMAIRGEDGTPQAGTFEVVEVGSATHQARLGTRRWWGGRSQMSHDLACRTARRGNAPAAEAADEEAAEAEARRRQRHYAPAILHIADYLIPVPRDGLDQAA